MDAMACHVTSLRFLQDQVAEKVFTPSRFLEWKELYEETLASYEGLEVKDPSKTGRLHFLQEGGGKTRVICIPDIWTQMVLRPIHDFLFNCLRRLPCDGTFSHSNLAKRVRKYTSVGKLTCYDLKAATDRMPVDLQRRILAELLGEELASL
jgi:hypothetical protein